MGGAGNGIPSAAPEELGDGGWVDDILLAGPGADRCLGFERTTTRAELRQLVEDREKQLGAAGLAPGGSLALRLPPSLGYVVTLLAAWRIGAQVALLDYRLTQHEIDRALRRLTPQLVVQPTGPVKGALRGYFDVRAVDVAPADGRPAQSGHTLVQLSSGSTGPSKVIGRSAADVVSEIERYTLLDGFPGPGDRVVLLASPLHVLGLVGGLLHSLHAGIELVVPERLTVDAVLRAVAAGPAPTTVLGVPFHAELLAAVSEPPELPQLVGMVTGGEMVREGVWNDFTARYGVPLGNMYGMTEIGVIATDLSGALRPALTPAPGIGVRLVDDEIRLARPQSPYVGVVDPARWADGWLRTKDVGRLDPDTGLLRVVGRLDSQISIGGLKVDLTEVEATIGALPGVADAVVLSGDGIEAYVSLTTPGSVGSDPGEALRAALAEQLAAYKRPKALHVLAALPRTSTGKLVRDLTVLRAAVAAGAGAGAEGGAGTG